MTAPPERAATIQWWVEKAEHDLQNAAHTLTLGKDGPLDTVCFHAQQCVEKYLKAVLLSEAIVFPRTHDLRLLVQLAPASFRSVLDLVEIVTLNRYAIETRYPGAWDPIELADAIDAVEVARKVREVVRARIPAEALRF